MASEVKPDLSGQVICQVIPALDTGGAERTTIEVARGIVRAGGRSLVVSEGGAMVAQLEAEGSVHVPLAAASKNPLVMASTQAVLRQLIAEKRITLLHARSRAPAWPTLGAARAAHIPFVTTYHGAYGGRSRAKQLYNSVMARGDVVIANSGFTAEAIERTYARWRFFDSQRLVCIPRGADLSRFDAAAVTPERLAAAQDRLGGQGALRILLPGRLTPWKGQTTLIQAARQLREQGDIPSFRVAITGDAQGREGYREELAAMIETADLGRIAHLAGHFEDMPAAYLWSDIVVSASTRPEAFGRVAVEAMAMGKPIIATAHGGSLETVVDGETGTLVEPGDADALASAIGALARDPGARAVMGTAGSRRARNHFTTEAMVNRTLGVYASLTKTGGTR